jgi:uncharacterized membrane protein YqiK
MQLRMALIKYLPEIIRESVKPMEKIDGMKIIQVDGLTGGGANGGGGHAGGGSASMADQLVSSATACCAGMLLATCSAVSTQTGEGK